MKRFKLILLGLVLSILSIGQVTTDASIQGDTMQMSDTIHFDISLETIISAEPIRKNEGLQEVMNQQVEYMRMMDDNLGSIDSTLVTSAQAQEAKVENTIANNNLDLNSMAKRKSTAIKVSNIATIVYILLFFVLVQYEKHSYFLKKRLLWPIITLISGIFILKFLLPQLLLGSYMSDYQLWDLLKFTF